MQVYLSKLKIYSPNKGLIIYFLRSITLFFKVVNPSILHSILSPWLIWTAPGVPVEITSPGNKVVTDEMNAINFGSENIILDTVFEAWISSLITLKYIFFAVKNQQCDRMQYETAYYS